MINYTIHCTNMPVWNIYGGWICPDCDVFVPNGQTHYCRNAIYAVHEMDSYQIMQELNRSVKIMKDRDDKGIFYQWIAYFLEAIESEIGITALETTQQILEDRMAVGKW